MSISATRKLFGTDGIRGIAGERPLDPATIYAAGLAVGHSVSKTAVARPRCCLAATRASRAAGLAATDRSGIARGRHNCRKRGHCADPCCGLPCAHAWIRSGDCHFGVSQSMARQRHQALRRRWLQIARLCGVGNRRRDRAPCGRGKGYRIPLRLPWP